MAKQSEKPKKKEKQNIKKLREEFLNGKWDSMTKFLEDKGLPSYYAYNKSLSGAVKEKRERQEKVEKMALSKQMSAEADEIVKARMRQQRIARYLQLRGSEALKSDTLKINNVEEARKLIVSGMEHERKVLGMDQADSGKNLTQININNGPKTNLDRLVESADYEELLGLIAEIKRQRARRSVSETSSDSSTEAEDGEVF